MTSERKILITGGFGFIGQNLARHLLQAGFRVLLTRFRTSTLAVELEPYVGKTLSLVDLDLREPWSVVDALTRLRVTTIVHLATAGWSGSVSADHNANVGGLLNLLESAHRSNVHRVIAASSIAVYGGARGPYREDEPLSVSLPGNGPGCFKRAEEIIGGFYGMTNGFDVVFARIGMAFGPGYRSMRNLVSRIASAIATGSNFDPAGVLPPYADYCHVDDVAAGLLAMVTQKLNHQIYNLGQGRGIGKDEMIAVASDLGLGDSGLGRLHALPPWPAEAFLDVGRARSDLGFAPKFDFAGGLSHYIRSWPGQAGSA